MDVRAILTEADEMFASGQIEDAGRYLEEKSKEALAREEDSAELSILNELTGYYRHSGRMNDAWMTAERMLELIEKLDLWWSMDGATALLNIATIYKEARQYKKAMNLYRKVQIIYQEKNVYDMRYLGLMNNMCVTSLQEKEYSNAWIYGKRAAMLLKELNGELDGYEREIEIIKENIKAARQYHQKDER